MPDSPATICQEIEKYLKRKDEEPDRPRADPAASFVQSAECGCRYCDVACRAVGMGDEDREKYRRRNLEAVSKNASLSVESVQRYDGTWKTRADKLDAQFSMSGLTFSRGDSSSELFVLKTGDDPIVPVSVPIPGFTGSDQSFHTAMGWLADCVKNHRTLCQGSSPQAGPPTLPLRVLDVGPPESQPIRLLQTNSDTGYYACLSHCWGGEQPLKTTLDPDTLSLHQEDIPWKDFPKTFQDAIVATRRFGIQYLWIDSLCIIQDDDEDWMNQSSLMAEIYRNSIITFAGSASSGPRQGLFRTADPEHIDQSLGDADGLEKMRTRKPLSHKATDLPLLQRGWVFQERQLSQRYLHFGYSELLWECMERQACECTGLGAGEPSRFTWLGFKNQCHLSSLQLLKSIPRGIADTWQAAVVDYSRLNLSYPSDIFPAISGIAKNIQEATGWEYIAGLWKENLITDLLWRVEEPQTACRCKEWRAPTFSWASVTTDIGKGSYINYEFMVFFQKGMQGKNRHTQRIDMYANVVESSCVPIGKDPTGRISSGYIILSGILIQATLSCSTETAQWQVSPMRKDPLSYSIFRNDFDLGSDHGDMKEGDTVFCLKLIGTSNILKPGNSGYLFHLVLKKVNSEPWKTSKGIEGEGEFERIGLLRDARGDDEERLEELSEEVDIKRDVLVKIH